MSGEFANFDFNDVIETVNNSNRLINRLAVRLDHEEKLNRALTKSLKTKDEYIKLLQAKVAELVRQCSMSFN